MKNPFIKHHNNGALMVSVAIGSVAAGAAAYLMLTEKGVELRHQIGNRLGNWSHKKEPVTEDRTAYLKKPQPKPKSDREAVLDNGPIPEQPGI